MHRKCKKQKESSIIMYTTSVIYAVFTMIRSRPVSCTYCHIINLSITTITLCTINMIFQVVFGGFSVVFGKCVIFGNSTDRYLVIFFLYQKVCRN